MNTSEVEYDFNREKFVKADTSSPEWQKYYADMKAWDEKMEKEKPTEPQPPPLYFNYYTVNGRTAETALEASRIYELAMREFKTALSQWEMRRFCDAPNKPGYYRANND